MENKDEIIGKKKYVGKYVVGNPVIFKGKVFIVDKVIDTPKRIKTDSDKVYNLKRNTSTRCCVTEESISDIP